MDKQQQFHQDWDNLFDMEDVESILQFLAREELIKEPRNQLFTTFLTTDHSKYQSSAPFFATNFSANLTPKPLDLDACTTSPTKESCQEEIFLDYPRMRSSLGLHEMILHLQRDVGDLHQDLLSTPALPLPATSLGVDLTNMPKYFDGDDLAGIFRLKPAITSGFPPEKSSAIVSCTTNSSLSSSLTEEAHAEAEECSLSVVGGTGSGNSIIVGSKRKALAMASNQNNNPVTKHQENQTKPASTKRINKRAGGKRYAIQTRSAKDILDDGYKWRKYGQKPVKNSPYPRSYYRCTWFSCFVKKMVERSAQDPGIVITTYQGVHIHPTPGAARNYSIDTSMISRAKHLHFATPIQRFPPCSNFDLGAQVKAQNELHGPQPQVADRGPFLKENIHLV